MEVEEVVVVEVQRQVVLGPLSVSSVEEGVCLCLISRFRREGRKYGIWASGDHLEAPDNLGEVRQHAKGLCRALAPDPAAWVSYPRERLGRVGCKTSVRLRFANSIL